MSYKEIEKLKNFHPMIANMEIVNKINEIVEALNTEKAERCPDEDRYCKCVITDKTGQWVTNRICNDCGKEVKSKIVAIGEGKLSIGGMEYKLAEKLYWMAVEFEKSGRQVKEGRTGIYAELAHAIMEGMR
jgi:hypothetical protein